jgi:hypothetical protein
MTVVSQFEVLLSGLIPGIPLPLVAQGYFLQVTNPTLTSQTVSIVFSETSGFANSSLTIDGMTVDILIANYLDASGNATLVSTADFLANSGFADMTIPSSGTLLFGLQAFPTPAITLPQDHPAHSTDPRRFVAPSAIPQFGIQWHGTVTIDVAANKAGGDLFIYPTTRGVFFDPIIGDTIEPTSDLISVGLTVGQTYSAVPTFDGTAGIAIPTS